jgi:hypothetical protein
VYEEVIYTLHTTLAIHANNQTDVKIGKKPLLHQSRRRHMVIFYFANILRKYFKYTLSSSWIVFTNKWKSWFLFREIKSISLKVYHSWRCEQSFVELFLVYVLLYDSVNLLKLYCVPLEHISWFKNNNCAKMIKQQ